MLENSANCCTEVVVIIRVMYNMYQQNNCTNRNGSLHSRQNRSPLLELLLFYGFTEVF